MPETPVFRWTAQRTTLLYDLNRVFTTRCVYTNLFGSVNNLLYIIILGTFRSQYKFNSFTDLLQYNSYLTWKISDFQSWVNKPKLLVQNTFSCCLEDKRYSIYFILWRFVRAITIITTYLVTLNFNSQSICAYLFKTSVTYFIYFPKRSLSLLKG